MRQIGWILGVICLSGVSDGAVFANDMLDGVLNPSEVVSLSSEVAGVLDTIMIERGDRVLRGQVVARLKSSVQQLAVERARARLDFARRKASRNDALYQREMISAHDIDEMETEILLAEIELRDAQEHLDMRSLRSPVSGVVVARFLSAGESVTDQPIVTVAQIHPLHVEVIVPVQKLGMIAKGQQAEVHPELPLKGVYGGRVDIVDEVIDAASGTFGVRIILPNLAYQIPAGLKCRVRFLDLSP